MNKSLVWVLVAAAVAGSLAAVYMVSASEDESIRIESRSPDDDVADLVGDIGQPYPYTTPIPPREPTALDGTYVRTLPSTGGAHVPCRRCAPYRLEGGRARLVIREGQFFITHELAGFKTLGHAAVSGSEVVFLNDPNCPTTGGRYRWSLDRGRLEFHVLEDDCPYSELRARYLTAEAWREP